MSMKRTCAISSSISFLVSVDTSADCRALAKQRLYSLFRREEATIFFEVSKNHD